MTRPASRSASILLCALCASAMLVACGGESPDSPAEPEPVADFSGLIDGWNAIEPGGETTCSDGSPYKFFVRPGDPERLVFYLQGGGGCWNGATCDRDLQPTYTINIGDLDPSQANGILAFDEAENPFADYSFVFVPYCSGDVHIGDAVVAYEAPATDEHESHEVSVQHRGATNVQAALDWTYSHIPAPDAIFVTGSSAGSIPSPYYSMLLADNYPDSRVAQLGDGSGGYRGLDDTQPHASWGTVDLLSSMPEFEGLTNDAFNFEKLYIAAAGRHPEMTFAAYDTAEDEVQKQFLALGGVQAESLLELLDANHEDILTAMSNYRSFIAGGELHTILLRPEFYTYKANGTRVRDWVAALASGERVDDVRCEDCSIAEVIASEDTVEATGGGS